MPSLVLPGPSKGLVEMANRGPNYIPKPKKNLSPFPSTHWSVVLAAGMASSDADEALAQVCCKYWWPLFAYVRRRGYQPEDAEDLTQEFLTRFIEKRYLGLADPQRGRFRCFLLTAMRHFLNDQWDRSSTAKRGGGRKVFSLDISRAEGRRDFEPADDLTPEKVYERCWGLALLETVLATMSREYAVAGKRPQFEALKRFLWGRDGSITYAQIASQLSMSESAVKSAVRRLRGRYGQLLREEIAQTVTSSEELEEEIRWLKATFA